MKGKVIRTMIYTRYLEVIKKETITLQMFLALRRYTLNWTRCYIHPRSSSGTLRAYKGIYYSGQE